MDQLKFDLFLRKTDVQVQVQVQVYFTINYRPQQFTLNYQIQFRTHFQIAVLRYDPNINMKNEILISG